MNEIQILLPIFLSVCSLTDNLPGITTLDCIFFFGSNYLIKTVVPLLEILLPVSASVY